MSKIARLLLLLFSLAALILITAYMTPRVLSAYFQQSGSRRLYQVINKLKEQPSQDVFCEMLPHEDQETKALLTLSVGNLNQAISQNPANSQAYLQLGKAQCLLGDYDRAQRSFEKYIDLKPKNPLGYLELGFVNERLGDQISANQAWSAANIHVQDFIELGEQKRKEKRYEEAADWFTRAIEFNPQNGDSWYEIGLLYAEMGQPEKAIDSFHQSLSRKELSYGKSSVNYQIGKAYLNKNSEADLFEARTAFEQAIELDQFNQAWEKADSHYRLGGIYTKQGEDVKKSIEEYKVAINIYPNHVNAHIALGEAYYSFGGDLQSAENEFGIALNIEPKNKWGYYRLGEIYRKAGIPEKAVVMYRKALEIDKNFSQAQTQLESLTIK